MSAVNSTAFLATTLSAGASMASVVAFTQVNSPTEKAACVAGALLGLSTAVGSTTAWLRSNSNTSVSEYLSNAFGDSGIVASGFLTSATGTLMLAAIQGAKKAIEAAVYDALRKKPETPPKPSKG
ncbi:MAG: hypothetical protein V4489_04525 [Chlamydiota bacterium]